MTSTDQARRVNLLVERLIHDPALCQRFQRDHLAVLREAGIDSKLDVSLSSGDFAELAEIGMHPLLQMHYLMILKPQMAAHLTIRHYPELVEGC